MLLESILITAAAVGVIVETARFYVNRGNPVMHFNTMITGVFKETLPVHFRKPTKALKPKPIQVAQIQKAEKDFEATVAKTEEDHKKFQRKIKIELLKASTPKDIKSEFYRILNILPYGYLSTPELQYNQEVIMKGVTEVFNIYLKTSESNRQNAKFIEAIKRQTRALYEGSKLVAEEVDRVVYNHLEVSASFLENKFKPKDEGFTLK